MASSQPSTSTLDLVIRTANNKHPDFQLQLAATATVLELKEKITSAHPTKPIPEDQRLIFSGKLLDDQSILSQVLIKSTSGSTYMIHLVLAADKNASSGNNVSSTPSTPASPSFAPPPPPPSSSSSDSTQTIPVHSSAYERYVHELNEYQQRLQQFIINPNGMPAEWNTYSQIYLQYCQTHYQMYENLLGHFGTTASSHTASTSNATAAAPPVPPAAAAAAAPVNNNNNLNELEQENDLLGVLNILAELFVFCSIIYFYSTFSRFLVVFVIFVLLYLHCRGYLSLQRRRRAAAVPPVGAAAAANDVDAAARDDEGDNEPLINEGEANPPETVRTTPNPSNDPPITATRLFVTAVSTFFSSLIPERPPRA